MKWIKNHPVIAVFQREVNRIKHYPVYRFMLFIGPLIGIFTMFFIFRQGAVREIPIAVVDKDNTTISAKISNALDASPDVLVSRKLPDTFEAKQLLEMGQIEAIIILPQNLEKNIYHELQTTIPVFINGTNVLKSGLVQRSVLTTLKTYSGAIQLNKVMLAGKSREQAIDRVVPVNIQRHVLFNPYTNYSYFLNSAMLYVMLYLFVFLSAIFSFGNELKKSTGLDLLEVSNGSVRLAVLGKIIPYTIIFSVFSVLINLLLYKVEGMPLNGSFTVIFLGQIVTIITYQLMGLMFVGLTNNLRLALSLGSAYSMMGITFSGLTFPMEAMPKIAQIIGRLFPFTWWEKIMISQSLRGEPIKNALLYLCYILIFQLISFGFLIFYKRYLGNPKYWGKL